MMSRLLARHLASLRRSHEAMEEEPIDRRIARRYLLPGSKVRLVVEGLPFDLHLKDLSWRGLCGLTDAPLARGQAVVVLFADGQQIEAEIRWARTVVVGAVFREALPDEMMRRLWRKYRSRRSRVAEKARPARYTAKSG
ncbi:MAG TPA: hypothetical protein VH331_18410 [Allosphingosinicella sp.]|jgi:hypothetical protein|nr:hypothetical protein [Allosphingosinicella sp.]